MTHEELVAENERLRKALKEVYKMASEAILGPANGVLIALDVAVVVGNALEGQEHGET